MGTATKTTLLVVLASGVWMHAQSDAVPKKDPPHPAAAKPYYETYGERQMAAGHYQDVIREQKHLLPLARAIWARAERGGIDQCTS